MLRTVQISLSSDQTDALLRDLQRQEGLLSVSVHRGVGLSPPGDLVSVQLTSTAFHPVLRLLDAHGLPSNPSCRITTSVLGSAASVPDSERIARGASDQSWEEMEVEMGKESNMTRNAMLVMALAGAIASIGLHSNVLHYVVAAMLLAPGFEPVVRIALGIQARSAAWRRGLQDLLLAYSALIVGAFVSGLVLKMTGNDPLGSESSYHGSLALISFWSHLSPSSLAVEFIAGFIGALLIGTGRAVLTGGVMIGLSLVPAAAFVGLGIAYLDPNLIQTGLLRWVLAVLLVLAAALLVMAWKRKEVQKRNAWL